MVLILLYQQPDLIPAMINPFIQPGLRQEARLITIPTTSVSRMLITRS